MGDGEYRLCDVPIPMSDRQLATDRNACKENAMRPALLQLQFECGCAAG
jgi:hypothetical protein